MRKIYLILAVTLISVTLIGCSNNEIVSKREYPIEVTSESSMEPGTTAPTEGSSFSASSELFSETSPNSETVAETETTAETVDIPVEIPHIDATEPQTEVSEPTTEVIETYPPTTESTPKEPIPTPTEKAEETTVYPETTAETTKREETTPTETTRETDPPQTTPKTEVTETTAETTAEPIPEPVKTPYDAPFDMEYIKSELIALGESMGMTHRTAYKDGEVITPDNSSWELPITASSSFCGEMLKRSLRDYVLSYAEYHLYGGEPITHFTIYVLPLSDGYEIYFLH